MKITAIAPSNILNNTALITIICTLIIIVRLFYLQIYHQHRYTIQSKKNYVRYETVSAARGQMLDRHGKKLATNKPIMQLYWHGTGNRHLTEEQRELLQQLAMLSGNIACDQETITDINRAEKRNENALLLPNISFEQLSRIEELCGHHVNIMIKHDFKRYYPHADMACHVVGYLSNVRIDPTGKMGLEKMLHDTLQGRDGMLIKTINSYGKKIKTQEVFTCKSGTDIITTLDIDMQQLVEKVFDSHCKGAFIIIDPNNGAIRALCSRPSFDPSLFLDPLKHQTWQSLQQLQPFLNRATQCAYPPGSLFKLITISAALEHDIINPNDRFVCKGYTEFGGRKYLCNRTEGHGTLTMQQALALSCNPLFYQLGQQMSIDTLADYAYRFGLGQHTGILFPEKKGLIPTTSWKMHTYGERWWPGETLSAAIGQSYLLVTPIQVARMIGSIFTGFLIKPRILQNESIEKIPLNIKSDTIQFLKDSMRSVVTQGTGHRVSRIKDYIIHAKTSTAQMSGMAKRKLGKQFLEHGWVVAHFAYKDHDPLVLVILIEHAGSSRVPMIIAKNFLLGYRDLFS